MNKQEIINRVKEKTLMGMCDVFIDGFMAYPMAGTRSREEVVASFTTGYSLLKQACKKLDDLLDDD
jgi:hypothetical protein